MILFLGTSAWRQFVVTPTKNGVGRCCWHLVGRGQGCWQTGYNARDSDSPLPQQCIPRSQTSTVLRPRLNPVSCGDDTNGDWASGRDCSSLFSVSEPQLMPWGRADRQCGAVVGAHASDSRGLTRGSRKAGMRGSDPSPLYAQSESAAKRE